MSASMPLTESTTRVLSSKHCRAICEEIGERLALVLRPETELPPSLAELLERLAENNASSPADSGGDIDAEWEDVDDSGAEAVFGHNPTPDQSDVE